MFLPKLPSFQRKARSSIFARFPLTFILTGGAVLSMETLFAFTSEIIHQFCPHREPIILRHIV